MGKKKDKKGKLPKTIAGVKIPKEARRQAVRAIAELKQPIVREMIAGAVGMAATALAKQAATMAAAPKPESKAEPAPHPEPKSAAKSNADHFTEIATGLAMAGLGKFFEKMQAANEAGKKGETPKK